MAQELIKEIGPHGETYLTTDHTLKWLRSKEYVERRLSVCGTFAAWESAGAKDTYQMARDEVRRYRSIPVPPFDAKKSALLDEIISGFGT